MTHESGGTASTDSASSEDGYLDRVANQLKHSYDLERDRRVEGEPFDLYGRLRIEHRKQFFHPALSYGEHGSTEHLFVRRVQTVRREDFEELVELGHTLADEWIEPDETHYSTEFTFALLARDIPDPVGSFVTEFRDRTLIKLGFHGHYEVNLLVVAPERERVVASTNADVATAFALWDEQQQESETGLIDRIVHSLLGR